MKKYRGNLLKKKKKHSLIFFIQIGAFIPLPSLRHLALSGMVNLCREYVFYLILIFNIESINTNSKRPDKSLKSKCLTGTYKKKYVILKF